MPGLCFRVGSRVHPKQIGRPSCSIPVLLCASLAFNLADIPAPDLDFMGSMLIKLNQAKDIYLLDDLPKLLSSCLYEIKPMSLQYSPAQIDDANLAYYYAAEQTQYGTYYRLKMIAPGFPPGFYHSERSVSISTYVQMVY